MTQIVDICKEHGIAMFCTFAIPTEDDDGLSCATHLPDGEGKRDKTCWRAYGAAMQA